MGVLRAGQRPRGLTDTVRATTRADRPTAELRLEHVSTPR